VKFLTRQSPFFKLVGGLGNQLFAISEGFSLHKLNGQKILFDISSVDHSLKPEIEINHWMEGLGDWFQIGNYESELHRREGINLSHSNYEDIKDADISKYYFFGWRPNLKQIRSAGLFQQGELPHSWKRFLSPSTVQYSHGFHFRLRDYLHSNALGGNISLDKMYLRKILNNLERDTNYRELLVVSDDIHNAKSLMSKANFNFAKVVINNKTPIEDLCQLSTCSKIYASPSTFSFWSAFFSQAEVFFPKPFFYTNPRWESNLLDVDWHRIRRIRFAETLMLEFKYFSQKSLRLLRR
jgi:Glycosyl transferase family 11